MARLLGWCLFVVAGVGSALAQSDRAPAEDFSAFLARLSSEQGQAQKLLATMFRFDQEVLGLDRRGGGSRMPAVEIEGAELLSRSHPAARWNLFYSGYLDARGGAISVGDGLWRSARFAANATNFPMPGRLEQASIDDPLRGPGEVLLSRATDIVTEHSALRANHPQATEWLLARLKVEAAEEGAGPGRRLSPEQAAAAVRAIEQRLPGSPAALEARERLIELLARQGGVVQALGLAQQSIEMLQVLIGDVDRAAAALAEESVRPLSGAIVVLGHRHRQRLEILMQRRREIQQTLRLFDRWRPSMQVLGLDLRRDRVGLRADIRRLAGGAASPIEAPERLADDLADRLSALQAQDVEQVRRMQVMLREIDFRLHIEMAEGLQAQRRQWLQWSLRFAYGSALALRHGAEQPDAAVFDLGATLALGSSEPLAGQLAKIQAERRREPVGEPDVALALRVAGDLAFRGETRELRAVALRTRALLLWAGSGFGTSAVRRHRQAEAVAHFESLLANYRDLIDAPGVLYQLAQVHERMGRRPDALDALQRLVQEFPQDGRVAEALFRIGELWFSLNDMQRARVAYESVLRQPDTKLSARASYMIGWCYLREGDPLRAREQFVSFLDAAAFQGKPSNALPGMLRQDGLRGLALALDGLGGPDALVKFFPVPSPFRELQATYESLGNHYLERRGINDAQAVYRRLLARFPQSSFAPVFLGRLIELARQEKLGRLAIDLQEEFVRVYSRHAPYWGSASELTRQAVAPLMQRYLVELGQMYHADAQREKRMDWYGKAVGFYGQLIDEYPDAAVVGRVLFLRAEARVEAGDKAGAIDDYEAAAYQSQAHADQNEAAYASLVATQVWVDEARSTADKSIRLKRLVERSERFALVFPGDRRAGAVLIKAAEDLLLLGDPAAAARLGQWVQGSMDPELARRAATAVAHGLFEAARFAEAESAYRDAIQRSLRLAVTAQQLDPLRERLALSVYRQSEALREAGRPLEAAVGFQRVAQTEPNAKLVPAAQIDAAVLWLQEKQWRVAIDLLEDFLNRFPSHPLVASVPMRLAYAYENSGVPLKAAEMFEQLSRRETEVDLARQAQYRAAELRLKGGQPAQAVAAWERYLQRFPQPLEAASEVRQRLADMAQEEGQDTVRQRWLKELVAEARKAGTSASLRTRWLAGKAALGFGDQAAQTFEGIRLRLPLEKSMSEKRRSMELALGWYMQAGEFGVAEITTSATYKTADLNQNLARDLIRSDRPVGISPVEREQYDLLLEEQAQPFEEKAIALHELNRQRMADGVFDEWVQKSLRALRVFNPGRYERWERSEDVFEWPPVSVAPAKAGSAPGSAKSVEATVNATHL